LLTGNPDGGSAGFGEVSDLAWLNLEYVVFWLGTNFNWFLFVSVMSITVLFALLSRLTAIKD
jgi:hypothetical protein